jgi:hypothetical protein
MPQRETALVGKNNVRAQITGQEELLVKVNSYGSEIANAPINVSLNRYTSTNGDTSGISVLSISFASVGTTNARVSVDGGMIYQNLAPGETLNLDAGGIMNFYNGNNFFWDTSTNAGSSLLIAYNYI